MKKSPALKPLLAAIAIFGLANWGLAQDSAQFVSERVSQVMWNENGKFLSYQFDEANGHTDEIGVFDAVHVKGKLLLKLTPKQTVDREMWLNGDAIELVLVSEPTQLEGKPATRETLFALYGNNLTGRKIWSVDLAQELKPQFSIEPSPSLSHAIVTVQTTKEKAYLVVTLGATDAVISNDVHEAIRTGHGFAGWTNQGTAFFGGGSTDDLAVNFLAQISFVTNLLSAANEASAGSGSEGSNNSGEVAKAVVVTGNPTVTLDEGVVLKISGELNNLFVLKTAHPAVPEGTEGYELMPEVGVLRPVKYPGPWVNPPQPPAKTVLTPQGMTLSFKDSSAGTKALWLLPNVKSPRQGTLVSAVADVGWLSPNGHTVAYTIDGVLFVKTVKEPTDSNSVN
jgi:hypothetical protein